MKPETEDTDSPDVLDLEDINGPDEIDEILAGLRALLNRASHPVVRGCLEETLAEIVHLTSADADQSFSDDQEVA
jgi:hypothetical protein